MGPDLRKLAVTFPNPAEVDQLRGFVAVLSGTVDFFESSEFQSNSCPLDMFAFSYTPTRLGAIG